MAGDKTHELEIRTIEHKEGPNVPAGGGGATGGDRAKAGEPGRDGHPHQESRDHHKHNDAGQEGHKRRKHGPAEEKH